MVRGGKLQETVVTHLQGPSSSTVSALDLKHQVLVLQASAYSFLMRLARARPQANELRGRGLVQRLLVAETRPKPSFIRKSIHNQAHLGSGIWIRHAVPQ